jgi:small subunit ribosomal protein S17
MEQETTVRRKRQVTGTVTSVSGLKSIVVAVSRRYEHPKFHKYITRVTKYMAHDEHSKAAVGDTVVIEESRPLSARKRWRVVAGAKAEA